MKFNKIFTTLLIVIISLFSVSVKAADLSINISRPTQAQVIVTNGLTIDGTAPAGVIVTVTIQDEEYQKAFQVHEASLITNGTTTSDKNGNWIFVPAKNFVPGKYSAIASFQNGTSGSISSEKVYFTVADESGATSWFSIPGVTFVMLFAVLVVATIYVVFKILSRRKRTMLLHTNWGDIPVREIIDENNIVEIVPLTQPMVNMGQPVVPMQALQPTYVALPQQGIQAQPNIAMQQIAPQQLMPQATQQPLQVINQPVYQQPVQLQIAQAPQQPVPQAAPTNIVDVEHRPVSNLSQPVEQVVPVQPVQQTPAQNPFAGRPLIKTTRAQLLN